MHPAMEALGEEDAAMMLNGLRRASLIRPATLKTPCPRDPSLQNATAFHEPCLPGFNLILSCLADDSVGPEVESNGFLLPS